MGIQWVYVSIYSKETVSTTVVTFAKGTRLLRFVSFNSWPWKPTPCDRGTATGLWSCGVVEFG